MDRNGIFRILNRIFRMLCSLKLAVLVILGLAISLAVGTILESLYDTPTSQYWVYRSLWFHGLLSALALNIFCVAMSRYPWKKYHLPFLMAHVGILMLLAGSWITERAGIDGNLRVSEGETVSAVDLDTSALVVSDQNHVYSIPIQWTPPSVSFKSMNVASLGVPYDLTVDQFLSHADPNVSFVANSNPDLSEKNKVNPKPLSAVHLRLVGGPMRISQDFWLWEGSPGWKSVQMGPARFTLGRPDQTTQTPRTPHQPWIEFYPEKEGSLSYVAGSSEGLEVRGRLPKGRIQGQSIQPGWKGEIKLVLEEWIPDALALTTYQPSRVQYGSQAPSSAIHVVASQATDVWLGLGDRAVLHLDGREIEIAYYPKRIILPFSLRLERFTVDHDPGTLSPAAYSSRVSILGGTGQDLLQKDRLISMNEPLQMGNYTLYQASYEDGEPRPVTSIFSVNRDPGRLWKYWGSLLIVLGSIFLFAVKYRRGRLAQKKSPSSLQESSGSPASGPSASSSYSEASV